MHVISVQGSQTQKSKLRNGHKVRIKHGAGFNVVVSPNTYHIVSRAFLKNKGISLQLSPEEIAMNRAPSPEMQQQIMGHKEHMVIPGVIDHINKGGRGLGTGIGDFFKDIGNKIKGAYETVRDTVRTPIENAIVNPIKQQYEKIVPEGIRKDISTGAKIYSPTYLLTDAINKFKSGKNPKEVLDEYREDLKHLNDTKNKVIKSSPALTEAYKKGVISTGTAAGTAFGTTLGLNPALAALGGVAGAKAGEQLLKAEGYGLHHVIDRGMHIYHKHVKHHKPILGMLGKGHISDFFKNAGNKVKKLFHKAVETATPYVEKGKDKISKLHEYILNNPELGKKIKEHGSKLAGILAKEGIKYMGGSDDLSNLAGDVGNELGQAGFKNVGYGEERPVPPPTPPPVKKEPILVSQYPPMPYHYDKKKSIIPSQHSPLKHDDSAYNFARQEMAQKGIKPRDIGKGLYAGRQRGGMLASDWAKTQQNYGSNAYSANKIAGKGIEPPSRLIGTGFNSYDSIHKANMGYSDALSRLSRLTNRTVQGQHDTEPIRSYYDTEGEPPSRGYGLKGLHHGKVHHRRKTGFEKHNHYNLVRGRGSLIEHSRLPPALQSQPYGANFHMQNMLPPQYQKYNDGTNEY